MGECADECIQLGLNQMDRNLELYGCVDPGNPKYDNKYWKDVSGITRKIREMDSMHLCFVLKLLQNSIGKIRNHIPEIKGELLFRINRGLFSKEDYYFHLEAIRLGLYCFYKDENNVDLEEYYYHMLKRYKYFDPPHGLFK